jgi:peptide chain release factor subunit 1
LQTKTNSLLHRVRSLADDRTLDHEARVSLRDDIARIEKVTRTETIARGTVVIFSCSAAQMLEVVRLPRTIRDRIMVDATPWIDPMLAVLDQYSRCCAAVVDRESARAWELYLGEMRDAGQLDRLALRNRAYTSRHGLSERRVRNKADELSKRHFREVAAAVEHLFRADRYDVLAVGGHAHELPVFLDFLPRGLRDRLAGTFSIDPHTATAATVRAAAESILDSYELDEQRRLVAELLQSAAAGDRTAVGLEPCLWAGAVAAIGTLLVQEGAAAPGVVCEASGWFATSGETCPLCGRATRHTPDVIDELVEAVIDEGGAIHHVRADTELRGHLTAAWLRFALPPIPEPT